MYNYKLIVPRVTGDTELFDSIVQANIKNISSPVTIYSVGDDYPNETIHSKYYKVIEKFKFDKDLKENDILIFSHNDCGILDLRFKEKIEYIFDKNEADLIGFVGSRQLNEDCCWWISGPENMFGHIIQGNKTDDSKVHLIKGPIGFYKNIVAIDGFCFVTLGKYFLNYNINFDKDTYKGNHFYDLDICQQFLNNNLKIAVAHFWMFHKSEGVSFQDNVWKTDRDSFISKFNLKFPFSKES